LFNLDTKKTAYAVFFYVSKYINKSVVLLINKRVES